MTVIKNISRLNPTSVLLIFNHGLGDFINFLPIFEELERRCPRVSFNIGYDESKQFNLLHSKAIDTYDLSNFDYTYTVKYLDPVKQKLSKPLLCNHNEIGLDNFIWKPYKLNISLKNSDSTQIGMHFIGKTNARLKNLSPGLAKKVWDEVCDSGFSPFEIHIPINNEKPFLFIHEEKTLYYNKPDLQLLIDKIIECKYFIGVDSGPFYLAGSILGLENCIGLEKNWRFKWFLPWNIRKITVSPFYPGKLRNILDPTNIMPLRKKPSRIIRAH